MSYRPAPTAAATASGPKPLVTATTVTEPGEPSGLAMRSLTRANRSATRFSVSTSAAPSKPTGRYPVRRHPHDGGLASAVPLARQDQWSAEQWVQVPGVSDKGGAGTLRARRRTASARSSAG